MAPSFTVRLGIDEAGRGCVLGPLCMAAVAVSSASDERLLEQLGCADSKSYGSGPAAVKARADIAQAIKAGMRYQLVRIPAVTVDSYVRQNGLNRLEQETAAALMSKLSFDRCMLDGALIFRPLTGDRVFAENKADETYMEVRAASIVAKDARDEALSEMYRSLGWPAAIPGGGYANPTTMKLLVAYVRQNGSLPAEYRHSYRWQKLRETLALPFDKDNG